MIFVSCIDPIVAMSYVAAAAAAAGVDMSNQALQGSCIDKDSQNHENPTSAVI